MSPIFIAAYNVVPAKKQVCKYIIFSIYKADWEGVVTQPSVMQHWLQCNYPDLYLWRLNYSQINELLFASPLREVFSSEQRCLV